MARIVVLGGTGYAGGHVVAEAAARGHEVTSFSRTAPAQPVEGITYRTGSVLDGGAVAEGVLAEAVDGADIVIESLAPRGELAGRMIEIVGALANRAQHAGVRVGVIGGAGSLFAAEGGPVLSDTDGFPAEFRPEAREMGAVLGQLKAWDGPLDWFFISPAANFGPWAPGERTGTFRTGGDVLLTDAEGNSSISGPDLAVAIIDEIETPTHSRQRFTVAY